MLPSSVKQQGINVMSRSSDIILFVALEADDPQRYEGLYLPNYAQLNVVDALSRLDGVEQVETFGSGSYSMRVAGLGRYACVALLPRMSPLQ